MKFLRILMVIVAIAIFILGGMSGEAGSGLAITSALIDIIGVLVAIAKKMIKYLYIHL